MIDETTPETLHSAGLVLLTDGAERQTLVLGVNTRSRHLIICVPWDDMRRRPDWMSDCVEVREALVAKRVMRRAPLIPAQGAVGCIVRRKYAHFVIVRDPLPLGSHPERRRNR